MSSPKVKVFLTIDSETWNFYDDFDRNHASAVYGLVGSQGYGLDFQLDLFEEHRVSANFFVEPLFSLMAGSDLLENMVSKIKQGNHDVHLHLHTEWLKRFTEPFFKDGKTGDNMFDFSLDQQALLVKTGKKLLERAGAKNVSAFRAGNYGANNDTLVALSRNGIYQDTSYNYCYLDRECHLELGHVLYHPERVGEVMEYPVTFFKDYPGHVRHLQISACSFSEMEAVLNYASLHGWGSVVIVLHTFECIQRLRSKKKLSHKLDGIVLQRLVKLVRFLDKNRQQFESALFSSECGLNVEYKNIARPPLSTLNKCLVRQYEQAYRKAFYSLGIF